MAASYIKEAAKEAKTEVKAEEVEKPKTAELKDEIMTNTSADTSVAASLAEERNGIKSVEEMKQESEPIQLSEV